MTPAVPGTYACAPSRHLVLSVLRGLHAGAEKPSANALRYASARGTGKRHLGTLVPRTTAESVS
jgi:hypothetical protein